MKSIKIDIKLLLFEELKSDKFVYMCALNLHCYQRLQCLPASPISQQLIDNFSFGLQLLPVCPIQFVSTMFSKLKLKCSVSASRAMPIKSFQPMFFSWYSLFVVGNPVYLFTQQVSKLGSSCWLERFCWV